jgi:hypothetical protein
MNADFLDAHQRHLKDAERLFLLQRWANADHLYGVAAECGLKTLMIVFGMGTDSTGTPLLKDDKQHADRIWVRFESYRSGFLPGAGYSLPGSNPFVGWNVNQRYAHQTNFDQRSVKPHQDGAWAVRDLVKKAQLEGLLI